MTFWNVPGTVVNMTRTIQNPSCTTACTTGPAVRRAFLQHAAALYGLSLDDVELDRLAELDDRAAVATGFPQLSDAELGEALWALGRFA